MGILVHADLFRFLPKSHQDRRIQLIQSAKPGTKLALDTPVLSAQYKQVGPRLGVYRAILRDQSGSIEAVWYKHLTYKFDVFGGLRKNVVPGKRVVVYGVIEMGRTVLQMRVEDHASFELGVPLDSSWGKIWPLYPSVEGLSDKWFRDIIGRVSTDAG